MLSVSKFKDLIISGRRGLSLTYITTESINRRHFDVSLPVTQKRSSIPQQVKLETFLNLKLLSPVGHALLRDIFNVSTVVRCFGLYVVCEVWTSLAR